MKPILPILVLSFFIALSCRRDTFIKSSDARIRLSADTIRFDTIFTSTGSVTQSFKLKNTNNQKLLVNNIKLAGGTASPFRINVDGTAGPEVKDIEVLANDSIYIFVSVSINPNARNLPFVVQDSIEIGYNGIRRFVQLESWGQNANFLRTHVITGHQTWQNNLPYVIIGGLLIDKNGSLDIESGCRIYMHADAPIVVDGTLRVRGAPYDSTRVYFKSDRLDEPYKAFPAGWPGIYFRAASSNNNLQYAVIQNAYQGIISDQPSINANPKVTLNQCIIDNIYDAGILAVQSSLTANNCLITNCGKNIQLVYGGSYQFNHCTVATYSSSYLSHKDPLLSITNFIKQDNTILTADLQAGFRNCILWAESGFVDNEVISSRQGTKGYAITFENCLWKVKTAPEFVTAVKMISNMEPVFDSINTGKHYYNFRLKPGSPAINTGVNTGLPLDLDGRPRAVNLPDLGAYEHQ